MKFRTIIIAALFCAACTVHAVELRGSNTEVAVAPNAPATTRFAAGEMTNYLSRILGSDIPLVTVPTEGRYTFILGTNVWSAAAGLHPETLPRDSYCVRVESNRAFIAGCDDTTTDPAKLIRSGNLHRFYERATLFGVYGFLDRHAGVRFYFPGELGTVVPKRDSLELAAGDYTVTPRFSTRDCYLSGAGPFPGIDPNDTTA